MQSHLHLELSAGEERWFEVETVRRVETQEVEDGGSNIGNAGVFQVFPEFDAFGEPRAANCNRNLLVNRCFKAA